MRNDDVEKVDKFLSFCIGLFKDLDAADEGDVLGLEFGGRRFSVVCLDKRRNNDDGSEAFAEFKG